MDNSDLNALRAILYGVIKASSTPPDIGASQNMGVNLTNTMKKDGVNIIQIQSVNTESIITKLVTALEMLDNVAISYKSEHEVIEVETVPKRIEYTYSDEDEISTFLKYIYEQGFSLDHVRDLLRVRYYEFLLEELGSRQKALDHMNVSSSSLAITKKRLKDAENANEESNQLDDDKAGSDLST